MKSLSKGPVITSIRNRNRDQSPWVAEFKAVMYCACILGLSLPVTAASALTDANWLSMGGTAGANGIVRASAMDVAGNLYIGGNFTDVGGTPANYIAKWNGNSWSA